MKLRLARLLIPCLMLLAPLPLVCANGAAALEIPAPVPTLTQPAAGPMRPGNVPASYVITPFGYMHPSCVQSLARGEHLLPDGRLQHVSGAVEAKAASCGFARFDAKGAAVSAASSPHVSATPGSASSQPTINGWVEDASVNTGTPGASYAGLYSIWTVPAAPTVDDGQTIYFFPGLEDLYDVQSILQPVLGWWHGSWTIASWNCCLSGVATSSAPVPVTPGDKVYGSVTNSCAPGSLSCATWNVLSLDMSTGESTTLVNTPSEGQIFDWAFGGVLEVYSVVSCNDLPPVRAVPFSSVTLFDQTQTKVAAPAWNVSVDPGQVPNCKYSMATSAGVITAKF